MVFLAAAVFLSFTLRGAENPVTVLENENTFTLANGIVTAQISKHSGDLISLEYKHLEMLDSHTRQPAYWSHDTTRSGQVIAGITIDPRTNGGERGEVSVKGIANGAPMGHGPGGSVGGGILNFVMSWGGGIPEFTLIRRLCIRRIIRPLPSGKPGSA